MNIIDEMKKLESPIDWNKPDYTGASAGKYVDKYTNRPEDAGTLEGLQNILGMVGMMPVIGEPADLINAGIYGSQGDVANAALYGSGIGMMGNIIGKNKETVKYIIKKLDDLGFANIGEAADAIKKSGLKNIDEFAEWYKKNTPQITPLQKKLDNLKNNPNFADNINRIIDQNIKRYNPKK